MIRPLMLALLFLLAFLVANVHGQEKPPSCDARLEVVTGFRAMLVRAYEKDLAALLDEVAALRAKVTELQKAAADKEKPK